MRVLLGQLGSNGDCLYATVIANQIKKDFPDCHLTWAISSLCSGLLRNNPHVDHVWEVPVADWNDQEAAWNSLENEVGRLQNGRNPKWDMVVMSQIWPNNFRNYDGTVRPSILRAYKSEITVPVDSVICLDAEELERVECFIERNGIRGFRNVILFESSSKSGQSYVTPEFANEVARIILRKLPNTCIILASHLPVRSSNPAIIDASSLTIREVAGLTHSCTLFVGCGSGLTVVSTADVSKQLPNIQLLKAGTSVYASFLHDFRYFGKPIDRFLEMYDAPADRVSDAVLMACESGIEVARQKFGNCQAIVSFGFYIELITEWLVRRTKYADAARSVSTTVERYGWNDELVDFARYVLAPRVLDDPGCRFADVRKDMRDFIDIAWST